jgi:hypothetical protein
VRGFFSLHRNGIGSDDFGDAEGYQRELQALPADLAELDNADLP